MAGFACVHEDFKPTKQEEFARAMENSGVACLGFDPRVEGVVMPPDYRPKKVHLGWLDVRKEHSAQNNLVVNEQGVSVTLRRRGGFRVSVPWDAIYVVLNAQLHGMEWCYSAPIEAFEGMRDAGLTCQTCWPKIAS